MAFVELFCTPEFYQHIVDQTNLYTCQAINAVPYPFTGHFLYETWVPVTVEEINSLGPTISHA
jgi:hypothetical protein